MTATSILALLVAAQAPPSPGPPPPAIVRVPAPPAPPPILSGPPPPPPPYVRGPSRSRANLASYFSSDDYPASALRAKEEGAVGFRLLIGPDGRVGDCLVLASSGSAALDAATCRILRSRARYTPARDIGGAAVTGIDMGRVSWRLAEERVDPTASTPPAGPPASLKPPRPPAGPPPTPEKPPDPANDR